MQRRARPAPKRSRGRPAPSPPSTSRRRWPSWPSPVVGPGRSSMTASEWQFAAAGIRWSRRRWPSAPRVPSSPTTSICPQDRRIWLLTGPNMAGKAPSCGRTRCSSSWPQTGSYVPADHARIGVIDRLFSRVGASDDLARGRSTFMVEMIETAAILNQATRRRSSFSSTRSAAAPPPSTACRSPGRSSSTCTTSAVAGPVRHPLPRVDRPGGPLDGVACHTMRVKEWNDELVFLHKVRAGRRRPYYGIHVARLAGLPAAVIARAEQVLARWKRARPPGRRCRPPPRRPAAVRRGRAPRRTALRRPSHRRSRSGSGRSTRTPSPRDKHWICCMTCGPSCRRTGEPLTRSRRSRLSRREKVG